MNWVDIVILAIVFISILIGFMRGFIREAFSLATWIAALIIANLFDAKLAAVMVNYFDVSSIRHVLAFFIIFIVTLIVGSIVSELFRRLVSLSGLGGLDRALGTIFGALRGVLLIVIITSLWNMLTPLAQDTWWHESKMMPYILIIEEWSKNYAFEMFVSSLRPGE